MFSHVIYYILVCFIFNMIYLFIVVPAIVRLKSLILLIFKSELFRIDVIIRVFLYCLFFISIIYLYLYLNDLPLHIDSFPHPYKLHYERKLFSIVTWEKEGMYRLHRKTYYPPLSHPFDSVAS